MQKSNEKKNNILSFCVCVCVHSVPVILVLSLCSEKSFHAASPAKAMPREANELSQSSNRIVDNPLRLQIKRNKSSHATVHVFLSIRIGNITFKSHLLQPSSLQSVWLYSGITNSSLCCTIEMFKSRIRSRDAASVEDGDVGIENCASWFHRVLKNNFF